MSRTNRIGFWLILINILHVLTFNSQSIDTKDLLIYIGIVLVSFGASWIEKSED
jgi:hypothetical protein